MVGDVIGLAWGVVIAAAVQMCVSIYVQHSLRFISIVDLLSGIWRVVSAALVMYFSLTFYFLDLPIIAPLSRRVAPRHSNSCRRGNLFPIDSESLVSVFATKWCRAGSTVFCEAKIFGFKEYGVAIRETGVFR